MGDDPTDDGNPMDFHLLFDGVVVHEGNRFAVIARVGEHIPHKQLPRISCSDDQYTPRRRTGNLEPFSKPSDPQSDTRQVQPAQQPGQNNDGSWVLGVPDEHMNDTVEERGAGQRRP
ncbi:MAG: hypothetical protein HP495_13170 [Nitrospira sp.]|nr:hypothetical protein [Nitrospira sp.]